MAYPWLTVFLEGTHATSAPKKTWTREDMQHIVSTTKTGGNDMIPFVGGHPKNNLPIFGYFSRDAIRLGEHDGKPSIQVQPSEFASGAFEALSKSEYDKVSISVDKGIINHIGFVKNPAVKNLPPLGSYQFSASDDTEDLQGQFMWQTGFEWAVSNRFSKIIELIQSLREDIIATDGNTDRADKLYPKELMDSFTSALPQLSDDLQYMIADEVAKQIDKSKQPSLFEENMDPNKKTADDAGSKTEQSAQFEAVSSELKKENEALKARLATLESENRTAKFESVVDNCIASGKVLPAERQLHIDTLNALAGIDSAQFSAAEKSPLDKYMEGLQSRTAMTGMFEHFAVNGSSQGKVDDDDKTIEEFNKSRGN